MPLSRDARGFSILEVLVAASLLATAVVALGHVLVLSANASRVARAQSVAVLLAAGKLEELTADAMALSAVPAPGEERVDATGTPYSDLPGPRSVPTYIRRWSAAPSSIEASLLQVQVEVIPWPGSGGAVAPRRAAAAVTLSSLVARRAP